MLARGRGLFQPRAIVHVLLRYSFAPRKRAQDERRWTGVGDRGTVLKFSDKRQSSINDRFAEARKHCSITIFYPRLRSEGFRKRKKRRVTEIVSPSVLRGTTSHEVLEFSVKWGRLSSCTAVASCPKSIDSCRISRRTFARIAREASTTRPGDSSRVSRRFRPRAPRRETARMSRSILKTARGIPTIFHRCRGHGPWRRCARGVSRGRRTLGS